MGCASSIESKMRDVYVCLSSFPEKYHTCLLYDPVFSKNVFADYMGVGGLKQPFHVAMSSAKRQMRS